MNSRERFLNVLNFNKVDDRLPMVEWAAWWDKTITAWLHEGLKNMDYVQLQEHFGLDVMVDIRIQEPMDLPQQKKYGEGVIKSEDDYKRIRHLLFRDDMLKKFKNTALIWKTRHEEGNTIVRLNLNGFFWFPRRLLGIEGHFYAFYDSPELIHRMNEELADFLIKAIDAFGTVMIPDMAGFIEDMSYNHGPMLSYEMFKEFVLPYYRKVIPHLKKNTWVST